MEKRDAIKYLVVGLVFVGLVVFLLVFRVRMTSYAVYTKTDVGGMERGANWDKIDNGDGSYDLIVYSAPVNYYDGGEYVPIVYGPCGSYCFRDWNGLIYRVSNDTKKAYINLYDVNDNYISSFGFGVTGIVGGTNYQYTTLNFTWVWGQEIIGDEYVFRAWNNRADFNWTQEFHFYPNQSMKVKNTIKNNLGVSIQNAKFWYIQTVGQEDGIWFNGTRYMQDTYKTGGFDSLLPQIKFEDYYVFEYDDLLENGFNITDFYLGDGSVIGVNGVRILAVGITKGNSVFPTGVSVSLDPTIKLTGSGGGDAYVRGDFPNTNYGSDSELWVKWGGSNKNTYVKFNLSSVPSNQIIDNASLCLYLFSDYGVHTIGAYHVYADWQENVITWNNQPCGTGFDNSSACNLTAELSLSNDGNQDNTWQCWNVVNMIKKQYNDAKKNGSIGLHTDTAIGFTDKFYSKEYSNSSLWPYLNITYHLSDIIAPNLTIISPGNLNYNNATVLVNISAKDPNLNTIWWFNGSDNLTYTSEVYYTFQEGSNSLIAYANDSIGNENSSSVSFFVDSIAPVINIILPQNGATYGYNNSIALNYSASDANLQSCWYKLDNGNNISLLNCQNASFNISEGSHILGVYANDSLGNTGNSLVSFNIQVGAPTIILNSPVDKYLNSQNIEFNYTPTDIDLQACELWGNFDGEFKLNQTITSPDNGVENSFSLYLEDGVYLWNIKCNDSQGNSAFNGNKTFYVDTIAPSLSLNEPSGTKTSRTVSASWSVSDINLQACWYNVYRGVNIEVENTPVSCSTNSTSFDVTVDADFIFNFYANDSAGNQNLSSLSFTVSTSQPSAPSGDGGGGGGGGGSGGRSVVLPVEQVGELEVSEIGDIIAREGDKKTLSLNVKNIGRIFLNNCRLIVKGDISSWVYSTKIEGIAPGENIDFAFDLNIPEGIESKDYSGELEIKCDEGSNTQNIVVSMPESFGLIKIKDMKQENDVLSINYDFDNSGLIGDSASVDIWIVDEDGIEIKRVQDVFAINKDGLIERSVEIEIPKNLVGIYYVYFALSSDLNDFIRQSVVLSKSGVAGFVVFDTTKGKITVYIIFLLIIGVAVFFIWRRHGKAKHSESKWFLGKKFWKK